MKNEKGVTQATIKKCYRKIVMAIVERHFYIVYDGNVNCALKIVGSMSEHNYCNDKLFLGM